MCSLNKRELGDRWCMAVVGIGMMIRSKEWVGGELRSLGVNIMEIGSGGEVLNAWLALVSLAGQQLDGQVMAGGGGVSDWG